MRCTAGEALSKYTPSVFLVIDRSTAVTDWLGQGIYSAVCLSSTFSVSRGLCEPEV